MCTKFENRVLRESAIIKASHRFAKSLAFGTRFFNAPWSSEIQPLFKSIISWYQQLVSYYESRDIFTVDPMSVENDCLLYLSHRLLSLPYQCSITSFEETIRLSIFVYSCIRIWSIYGTPCLESQVEMLRESLSKNYFVLQSTASDLLFWILFTGSLASKGMGCNSWFLTCLVDIRGQLSLEWDSAVSMLEEFFFVCRPQDEPAKELWISAFQGRNPTTLNVIPAGENTYGN